MKDESKTDDPYEIGRGGRSNTLFSRSGKAVVLEDFDILKVIGKGTFGKVRVVITQVFLVEKRDSKEIYAMKALRKDVLIDYDQVENTKLEKEILLRVSLISDSGETSIPCLNGLCLLERLEDILRHAVCARR